MWADIPLAEIVLFLLQSTHILRWRNILDMLVQFLDLGESGTVFSYSWRISLRRKSFLTSIPHRTFETTVALPSLNSEDFFLNLLRVNFGALFLVFSDDFGGQRCIVVSGLLLNPLHLFLDLLIQHLILVFLIIWVFLRILIICLIVLLVWLSI